MSKFLNGKICYLRPLEFDDLLGGYPNWLNDPEVCKYNGHLVFPYTHKQAEDYITFANNTKDNIILAIIVKKADKAKDTHIGNIALQNINLINRTADISIIIGEKEFWGKGYATEAYQLLIEHGFKTLNLNRIACGTMEGNVAMKKLAIALGFKEEGNRRQALFKNGEYVDVIEFGLLKKTESVEK
jgi:RimJ/RimL family protein N-acetyltransferase